MRVASTLQIADHLNDGARSAEKLASLTGSDADALYRLLRTCRRWYLSRRPGPNLCFDSDG
ncbi:methyltransferase family protein [Bradyrhizobium japonicum]|uniref:methyltransferase family protein n=1 Tax=Bradyrhizobium japonicum TaxID=375 RepID=UPI003CF63C42